MPKPAAKKTTQCKGGRPFVGLAISDDHVPDDHKGFTRAKQKFVHDARVDGVLIVGDHGEWASGSRHVPPAMRPAYADEAVEVRQNLRDYRRALRRGGTMTWVEGNHDNAVLRMLSESASSMVKGFWDRFAAELDFERLGVEWVPEAKPWRMGNLLALHGHQEFPRGAPKHHAMKMADLYGAPGFCVIYGHTHRPQTFIRPWKDEVGGNAFVCGMGCGKNLNPAWLKGSNSGWEMGCSVFRVWDNGDAEVVPIRPRPDGSFHYGGALFR